MNKIQLLEMLTNNAREYRIDANTSLMRNVHMHKDYNPGIINIPQPEIDALLTDFINFVGAKQGLDYALYTEDLRVNK